MDWEVEQIPDGDALFMRVHRQHFCEGELMPGAFRDQGAAMSVNWTRYCPTAQDARAKARVPDENGVISMITGDVRRVPLAVNHSPNETLNDRSHTDVVGDKRNPAYVRVKLLKCATIEIPV